MVQKGSTMSAASRAKMSAAAKARPSNRTGKRHTPEARALISERTRERTPRGTACHSYIDGRHAERQATRAGSLARQWSFDVKARDGFACCHCGDDRGGNLHAHHIKSWARHPELRFDLENGITVCDACHWLVHRFSIPGF
jgi:5-methylcytosine-specific restriction endonuclease McrA